MEELISIIVPVYNTEPYLQKCLESILSQDYRSLEIILIDDGSSDRSAEICEEYIKKDARIIFRRLDHRGVSAARNEGLRCATGSWVGFVDSDDYIERDMYRLLIEESRKTSKKILCCSAMVEDMEGNQTKLHGFRAVPDKSVDLSREEALLGFLNPTDRFLYCSVWSKLIRADLAKQIRFDEGHKLAEDYDYSTRCLLQSDGLRYVPQKSYHYIRRPGSITAERHMTKTSFDRIYFAGKVIRMVQEHGYENDILLLAKVYQSIAAARLIRFSYQDQRAAASFKDEIDECRNILNSTTPEIIKQIHGKIKLLVLAAKYIPWLFKVS